ncbi:MAG: type IV secretory system conjugative DNA transfer family protein, partial [Pseudonocardiaceae bacterium]
MGTRWWITGIGAGIALCAWLVNPTLAGAGLAVALVGAVLWWRYHRSRSAGLVTRWSRRSRRNDGVASVWAILRVGSSWAVRRKTRVLRPSLAGVSRWRRWRTPIRELATPLARVGMLRVWSPIEDVTVGLGGPRCGKTGELCCRILDAPGAVIATSTRTDLIEHTAHDRGRWGRPVGVFNPSGVGGVPSTITFSPLTGCENPTVATARATDLLSATAHPASGDAEHWLSLARLSLAPLLHAAALGDGTMWDVRAWIADPERAGAVVQRLLARSRTRVFDCDAEQFFTTGDRTRASICATIMPCLAWLT